MTSVPLAPLLEQWLTALPRRYQQPGIIRRYRSAVKAFLSWYEHTAGQPLTLDRFTPALLVDYRTYLHEHQVLSPRVLNGTLEALQSWYTWLVKAYAPDYLLQDRSEGKGTRWRCAAPTPAQVTALLEQAQATVDGVRNVAIVQILLQTGMRVEECSRLTWADVVLGELQGNLIIRQESGTCSRQLPLPPPAQQSLLVYLATYLGCAPTLAAVTEHWPPPGTPESLASLWRSRKGGTLTSSAIDQMLLLLIRLAATQGLLPTHTNAATLRRTFARTYLTQHPGDYEGLAAVLEESVSAIRSAFCTSQAGAPVSHRGRWLSSGDERGTLFRSSARRLIRCDLIPLTSSYYSAAPSASARRQRFECSLEKARSTRACSGRPRKRHCFLAGSATFLVAVVDHFSSLRIQLEAVVAGMMEIEHAVQRAGNVVKRR